MMPVNVPVPLLFPTWTVAAPGAVPAMPLTMLPDPFNERMDVPVLTPLTSSVAPWRMARSVVALAPLNAPPVANRTTPSLMVLAPVCALAAPKINTPAPFLVNPPVDVLMMGAFKVSVTPVGAANTRVPPPPEVMPPVPLVVMVELAAARIPPSLATPPVLTVKIPSVNRARFALSLSEVILADG